MVSEFFLAEVNLDSSNHEHQVFFDRTQANCCLAELGESYDEVLVVNNQTRLLLMVVGQSPDFVLNLLADVSDGDAEVTISSSQHAISVLMAIATGRRWPEVPIHEIRRMIMTATRHSIASGYFGARLRGIIEAALFANTRLCKKEESRYYHSIIHKPSFVRLDFSKMPIN